jgi:hypothetical protein
MQIPNTEFLYRGNDIVKLWEKYLKTSDSTIKFYLGYEGYVDSIFNGLSQNNELAIVTNNDETLYQNKDEKTITLCGEIDYINAIDASLNTSIISRIQQALEQIELYNSTKKQIITRHIIIFPYHAGPVHWNLGKIELKFNSDGSLQEALINIYEPLGGQASDVVNINSLDSFSKVNIKQGQTASTLIKQQHDSSSCGAITAENGKEFLKNINDGKNLLQVIYARGCSDLRMQHIQEIDLEEFFTAQRDNKVYEVTGDKSIENKFEVIQFLKTQKMIG